MRVPEAETLETFLEGTTMPAMARLELQPDHPRVTARDTATRSALEAIDVADCETVALAVGSRGISGIDEIVETTVSTLVASGCDPVIVPAMGSHGGATPEGQRAVLAELGIRSDTLDCPIDASMDTTHIGDLSIEGTEVPIRIATSALAADAILPINRIKPHTSFSGPLESGICKLLIVGLGKHRGARMIHEYAPALGFDRIVSAAVDLLQEATNVPGGIAILEQESEDTAAIEAVQGPHIVSEETTLLERARTYTPSLPFDEIDLLVVDRAGKDISGTGMDTNVIGRSDVGADPPCDGPSIERIYLRSLSSGSGGNANGVGMADIVHVDVLERLELAETYGNVLTSGNLRNGAIPVVLPSDRLAITAAIRSLRNPDPDAVKLAWIHDTSQLHTIRVSEPLLTTLSRDTGTISGWERLTFVDGRVEFTSTDSLHDPRRED